MGAIRSQFQAPSSRRLARDARFACRRRPLRHTDQTPPPPSPRPRSRPSPLSKARASRAVAGFNCTSASHAAGLHPSQAPQPRPFHHTMHASRAAAGHSGTPHRTRRVPSHGPRPPLPRSHGHASSCRPGSHRLAAASLHPSQAPQPRSQLSHTARLASRRRPQRRAPSRLPPPATRATQPALPPPRIAPYGPLPASTTVPVCGTPTG
jgi:hypothetical protein